MNLNKYNVQHKFMECLKRYMRHTSINLYIDYFIPFVRSIPSETLTECGQVLVTNLQNINIFTFTKSDVNMCNNRIFTYISSLGICKCDDITLLQTLTEFIYTGNTEYLQELSIKLDECHKLIADLQKRNAKLCANSKLCANAKLCAITPI